MGSLHKSVATLLIESAKDEEKSDQDIIKALAIKVSFLFADGRLYLYIFPNLVLLVM